jgi:uncharacterized protein with HEPN domain
VSRHPRQRLKDVVMALDAIDSYLERGGLSDGLVFDAVRVRLIEIGEAVKAVPAEVLAREPDLPWSQIARMRDHLAHHYFDTALDRGHDGGFGPAAPAAGGRAAA